MDMIPSVERYSVIENEWENLPDLHQARQNASLAVYNMRYLYAFAGYDGYDNLNNFEILDLQDLGKGWEMVGLSKMIGNSGIDIKKNRMGVIPLDFDRILIFGGENKNKEYKESYIFEFYENKFYHFGDLARTSNFVMSPVYYHGKYVTFDFLNNIHQFNLDSLEFEYHIFQKEDDHQVNL